MSLASAFTLSRLSDDLTYDLSRTPEVPEELTVQCAVSRGKMMVLLESPKTDTVPENYVFAQVETLVRHRLEIDGLPIEASHLGVNGEPVAIKVYLKQTSMPKPSAVHRFNWLLQDSSGPVLLEDDELEPLLTQQPEIAPDGLFEDSSNEESGGLSEEEFLSEEIFLSREEFSLGAEQPSGTATDELLDLDNLYEQAPPSDTGEPVFVDSDDLSPEESEGSESSLSPGLVAVGIGVAAIFGALGYGLSRPCVLGGRCDRIQQAQSLGDAALIALQEDPTPQTVLDMREQLNTAVDTLKPIPPWSGYRTQAQKL